MKIDSREFLEAVNAVLPARASKSYLHIAELLHIEGVGSEIIVTATDLENNFSFRFPKAELNDESFVVCVDPKLLTKALEGANCDIDFRIDERQKSVAISYDGFLFTLSYQPGDDFPNRIEKEDYYEFGINFELIKTLIDDAIGFACTDELKLAMCGINFELEGENLTLVATDAHSLCQTQSVRVQRHEKDNRNFILEVNAAKKLKAVANSFSFVNVRVSNKWISIVGDKFTYNCRRLEAVFPNYRAITEQPNPNTLLVNKKEILAKLKKLTPFSTKINNLGKFSINLAGTDSKIYIVSEDETFTSRGSTEIAILATDGADFPAEIGFNIKLFMNCLSFFDDSDVKLCFSGESNSTAVMFAGTSALEQSKFSILMPIMLQD